MGSERKPLRGPRIRQPISAATPALMCTTVPPAKSIAPQPQSNPALIAAVGAVAMASGPGHHQTMCAIG